MGTPDEAQRRTDGCSPEGRHAEARALQARGRGGLYLLINPDGSRWSRGKSRYGGKEKLLSVGVYQPGAKGHVPAKEARDKLEGIKRQLRNGIDPSAARRAEQQNHIDREEGSFERVAREWLAKQGEGWAPGHTRRVERRLVLYVFPKIGREPIRSLAGPQRLAVLQAIEERGTIETAHRVKESLGGYLSLRHCHAPRRPRSGRAARGRADPIQEQGIRQYHGARQGGRAAAGGPGRRGGRRCAATSPSGSSASYFALRIEHGPGCRVHCGQDGNALVRLLCGGDKRTQQRDKGAAHGDWQDCQKRTGKRRVSRGRSPSQ